MEAYHTLKHALHTHQQGFEADVGSKTTYDLLNKENCMKLTKGEHKWRRPKSTVFLFESHSRIIRAQVYSKFFSRAALRSGDETALVLQPALMTTSRTIYLAIKAEAEDEINALRLNWGSTGQLNRTKVSPISRLNARSTQQNTAPLRVWECYLASAQCAPCH